ncbi:MAG: DUF1573 domain-containing protein [Spirochaetales bacterium]|nr:DUF1573 domain-containing protein [Spirochaetales bacterium]
MSVESKRSTGIFLFFTIILFLLPGCFGKTIKGPAIVFEKDAVNFGEVREGDRVPYSFSFSNPGSEVLVINDLLLSCWCLSIERFDRVIEPGGSGVISGDIRTTGFSGYMAKVITVQTNIPETQPMLTLEGMVVPK